MHLEFKFSCNLKTQAITSLIKSLRNIVEVLNLQKILDSLFFFQLRVKYQRENVKQFRYQAKGPQTG